jgi:membrane glycosyltransferase
MRMRQSIADIEDAFFEEIEEDRERRERLRKSAERRAAQRQAKRTHRHGSMRFIVLVLVLVATAAIVTYAMFATLYYVLSPS